MMLGRRYALGNARESFRPLSHAIYQFHECLYRQTHSVNARKVKQWENYLDVSTGVMIWPLI